MRTGRGLRRVRRRWGTRAAPGLKATRMSAWNRCSRRTGIHRRSDSDFRPRTHPECQPLFPAGLRTRVAKGRKQSPNEEEVTLNIQDPQAHNLAQAIARETGET